jgi:hypothetical protein
VIDFRYHLVSIIAVFLALALGLVVGAAALQPKETQALLALSSHEKTTINSLEQKNGLLNRQNSADQSFAQAASGLLLGNLLDGQRVVLVTAPGADGTTISGVTAAARQAGAKVTGQVSLEPQFFDTSGGTESSLDALARQLAPPGVAVGGDAANPEHGQQAAASVIAAALVTKDSPAVSAAVTQSSAILNGFGQQGFLQVSANGGAASPQAATLAVVVIPATPPGSESGPVNQGLVAVAQALQGASSGAVLAGSLAGSGPGSAIDAIASGNISASLTTVDNADLETGQIVVAQALAELLAGSKPAQYGVASNAAPSPAPRPSPSATAQGTPTAPARKTSPKK